MSSSDDHLGETELKCFSYGRIVRLSKADLPYKVILMHNDQPAAERSFATLQEAEAFLRRNTPRARPQSTGWDHRRS
jgi:hypothetical protein